MAEHGKAADWDEANGRLEKLGRQQGVKGC